MHTQSVRCKILANKPRGISCREIVRRVISNWRLHLREKRDDVSLVSIDTGGLAAKRNTIGLVRFSSPRVENNCLMTNEFEDTMDNESAQMLQSCVN